MASQTADKSLVYRLQNLDRRIIYLLLVIVLVIPLVRPFSIPLRLSSSTQLLYDRLDALESGDVVLMSFDYSASSAAEIHAIPEALMRHLATKQGVRVIGVSFTVEGDNWAERALQILGDNGKVYGTDYVNLGYKAGGESAIALAAENLGAAFPRDFHDQVTAELPVMKGIGSASDIAIIMQFNSGFGVNEFIRQVGDPYKVPLAIGLSATLAPSNMPYLQSGQLMAILGGLRGAAEYEILTKQPGNGSAAMTAQFLGHLLVLAFLVIGNVCYLVTKSKKTGMPRGLDK